MSYIDREVFAGDFYQRRQYHTGRFHPRGEHRAARVNPSPESVKQANAMRARDTLMWKLNENFKIDDWWVTLTYEGKENKKRTYEQMQHDLTQFLKEMRKEYRSRGRELKFCAVIRVGKRSSRHFHLVMNDIEKKAFRKHWPYGFTKLKSVWERDDSGVFDFIAKYMIEESETSRETLQMPSMKRYTCSRNLRPPKIVKRIVKRSSTFRRKMRVPEGYKLIRDSEKTGVDLWGNAWYEYKCARIC